MQDNFNLAKFVRQNRLLKENIGGYVDIKPLKEMNFDEMMGTAMEDEDFFGDTPEETQNLWMEDVQGKQIKDWTCFYQDQVGSIGLESDRFPGITLYATPGFLDADGIVFEAWDEEGNNIDLNPEDPETNQYVAGKSLYADFDSYAQDMKQILAKVESMLQGGEAMNELEKPKSIYVTDDSEDEKGFIVPGDDDDSYFGDRFMDQGGDEIEKHIVYLLGEFDPEDLMDELKKLVDKHS